MLGQVTWVWAGVHEGGRWDLREQAKSQKRILGCECGCRP